MTKHEIPSHGWACSCQRIVPYPVLYSALRYARNLQMALLHLHPLYSQVLLLILSTLGGKVLLKDAWGTSALCACCKLEISVLWLMLCCTPSGAVRAAPAPHGHCPHAGWVCSILLSHRFVLHLYLISVNHWWMLKHFWCHCLPEVNIILL